MILIQTLRLRFEELQDPFIAAQQSAYMRNLFPFLGIKKPPRSLIQKEVFKAHPVTSERELIRLLNKLWELPEREYQMAALDLAYAHRKLWTPEIFPCFEKLIRTKSWWDSVDTLASNLVGPLLQKYPSLKSNMDMWIEDDFMWIRRTALIYQLSYKKDTQNDRLFRYCKLRINEKEFFIRKAIGWALRHYARTDPEAVCQFVLQEKNALSPLSYREATKHLIHLR